MKSLPLIALFAVLLIAPLVTDQLLTGRRRAQYTRDDELFAQFDCEPVQRCMADFDGDGIPASFDVQFTHAVAGYLTVTEGRKEVLRLSYDHTDGTLRTHLAIQAEFGKPRLLVYDGASQNPPLKAAFGWNGEKLAQLTPEPIDRKILSAMAAHDDTGGWDERAFDDLFRIAALVASYTVIAIFIAIIVYMRQRHSVNTAHVTL